MSQVFHLAAILQALYGEVPSFRSNMTRTPSRGSHPKVLMIHGFQGKDRDFSLELRVLKKIYPSSECTPWRWNTPEVDFYEIPSHWEKAVQDQVQAAEDLFRDIQSMSSEEQRRLILVGHSLGGGIVIHALAKCQKTNIKIDHFLLLGAAINNDDPDIARALDATTNRSINLVNTWDYALAAYLIVQQAPALGTGSALANDDRLCELAFNEKMGIAHDALFYLMNFQKCLENKQVPSEAGITTLSLLGELGANLTRFFENGF